MREDDALECWDVSVRVSGEHRAEGSRYANVPHDEGVEHFFHARAWVPCEYGGDGYGHFGGYLLELAVAVASLALIVVVDVDGPARFLLRMCSIF